MNVSHQNTVPHSFLILIMIWFRSWVEEGDVHGTQHRYRRISLFGIVSTIKLIAVLIYRTVRFIPFCIIMRSPYCLALSLSILTADVGERANARMSSDVAEGHGLAPTGRIGGGSEHVGRATGVRGVGRSI